MIRFSYRDLMASTRLPHPLPTRVAAEFEQLAAAIAHNGVAPNAAGLVRLARSAESLGLPAGAIAALIDPTSAPVVRERAAVCLSLAAARDRTTADAGAPQSARSLRRNASRAEITVSSLTV